MKDLYKIQKKDIQKAGVVLADAFQNDPFFKKALEDFTIEQKQVFYEGSVRYCFKYGEVYATSENLEGIAAWVPSNHADMTTWRAIRSGSFNSIMKIGKQMFKMKSYFEPLEVERRKNMKGKVYIYFIIVGIATKFHGKGFGKKLIGALIEKCEQTGMPLYLETTTEKNIRMYEKMGFRVLNKVIPPGINLPQWGLLRDIKV